MTLGEKIAVLRGELSQGDLAEKLDVSRQSVSKWETGLSLTLKILKQGQPPHGAF